MLYFHRDIQYGECKSRTAGVYVERDLKTAKTNTVGGKVSMFKSRTAMTFVGIPRSSRWGDVIVNIIIFINVRPRRSAGTIYSHARDGSRDGQKDAGYSGSAYNIFIVLRRPSTGMVRHDDLYTPKHTHTYICIYT